MVDPIAGGIISGFAQVHWCRISGNIIEFEDRTGTRVAGGAANGLYRSFRNYFCDDPPAPAPPGTFEPPFTGGQCNKQYLVNVRVVFEPGEPDEFEGELINAVFDGPVTNIFVRRVGFNSQVVVRAADGPGGPQRDFMVGGGTGNPEDPSDVRITSASVTPLDGIDDCGNPPPVAPPPGDEYYTDNFTVTVNNGGNSFSFPISITSNPTPPTLDGDGDLSVPITITFPDNDQSFDIDLNQDGEFNFTGGSPPPPPNPNNPPDDGGVGGSGNPPNTDPDEYDTDGEPPPTPPGTEEPPVDPEAATAIRGAIVTCTNADSVNGLTRIFQSNGLPTVYAPYLGLVSFYIKTVDGTGGWTEDIPVKNVRQFVPCPWVGGAADVRVSPRSNALLQVTPVLYKLDE